MAKKHRMTIHDRDGYSVMDTGEVEIWDGADLALLRETLFQLINRDGQKQVGVELMYVKYIPSGFFGMLYDWYEKGVAIRLYSPQPHIKNMLWFRQFFDAVEDKTFKLLGEPKQQMAPDRPVGWNKEIPWNIDESENPIPAASSS